MSPKLKNDDTSEAYVAKRAAAAGVYECATQHPERKFDENGYKYRDFCAGADWARAEAEAEIELLKSENADLECSRAMLSRQEKEYLDRCGERDAWRAQALKLKAALEAMAPAWREHQITKFRMDGSHLQADFALNEAIASASDALRAFAAWEKEQRQ
jgi:hypothetical protein